MRFTRWFWKLGEEGGNEGEELDSTKSNRPGSLAFQFEVGERCWDRYGAANVSLTRSRSLSSHTCEVGRMLPLWKIVLAELFLF